MRAVGSAVVCMSVAEVPEGRQRSPYLVGFPSADRQSAKIDTGCRLLAVRTRPYGLSRWTLRQPWRPYHCRCVALFPRIM
jgi:hypothetical protein